MVEEVFPNVVVAIVDVVTTVATIITTINKV
jgi:hypothetical protein